MAGTFTPQGLLPDYAGILQNSAELDLRRQKLQLDQQMQLSEDARATALTEQKLMLGLQDYQNNELDLNEKKKQLVAKGDLVAWLKGDPNSPLSKWMEANTKSGTATATPGATLGVSSGTSASGIQGNAMVGVKTGGQVNAGAGARAVMVPASDRAAENSAAAPVAVANATVNGQQAPSAAARNFIIDNRTGAGVILNPGAGKKVTVRRVAKETPVSLGSEFVSGGRGRF